MSMKSSQRRFIDDEGAGEFVDPDPIVPTVGAS
jgi:hypothetical protein